MPGFDYGNARIRAMKSRLLSQSELEVMADVDSLQGLIAALTKTAYRKPIEVALARVSGLECIIEALHNDLIFTIGKIRGFYRGKAGEIVAIVLRKYDIYNIKAILRGLAKNASSSEILSTMLPVGELIYSTLSELARAPSPRACTDILASMGLPFAHPLLKLNAERPGAETGEMELALDQWYYIEAFQSLESMPRDGRRLLSALQLEADLENLVIVLRFAHTPSERKFLRDWLDTDELEALFVGPGRLPFTLLARAGGQGSIEAAVDILTGTIYASPLSNGMANFAQSTRLSDFEKHLSRFRLEWMARQIIQDPLGIGVLLGYLALKINEVSNIRWIAQGLSQELKAGEIYSDLRFVS